MSEPTDEVHVETTRSSTDIGADADARAGEQLEAEGGAHANPTEGDVRADADGTRVELDRTPGEFGEPGDVEVTIEED